MSEPTQRMIESNGIRLNIAEQGEGPPVLLCHGFPESWYSWRHQLAALAAAGFHAVAPATHGGNRTSGRQAKVVVPVIMNWNTLSHPLAHFAN